tara:strand:- start:210 stop:569 length:360 start_codon:yes stop_codon:yes gene_type:complete
MPDIVFGILHFFFAFLAFVFCIFFTVFLIKICVFISDWVGFIIHHIYWRFVIWWNGWEFDVPNYWDDFDVDEYIDNLIELEMGYIADDEEDIAIDNSFYVVVINPNGEISIGKAFTNTN